MAKNVKPKRIIDKILECIVDSGYQFAIEQDDDYYFDFRIKQCKGWLFGIRVDDSETFFFCQYVQEIDKFKPSRSEYVVCVNNENLFDESVFVVKYELTSILRLIRFIHQHPLRAWYKDFTCVDYNMEYRSSLAILRKYISRKLWWKRYLRDNKILDFLMLKFVKRKVVPYLKEDFDKVEIVYQGKDTYPKYEIYCYTLDPEMQKGWYSIFGDGEELEAEWNVVVNKLYKISEKFKCHWSCPFNNSIGVFKIESSEV